MPTKIAFQLIPLERLSAKKFDPSQLPFDIMPGVDVADVSELLSSSMFQFMSAEVGRHRMRFFDGITKHAIVHRYEEHQGVPISADALRTAKQNDELLNEVFACSRIVRPTRRMGSLSGYLNPDGTVDQRSTSFPASDLDVPEALKLFAFRNKDLETLRDLVGPFITAVRGEYWPFRMAVQYYYMGYEVNDW